MIDFVGLIANLFKSENKIDEIRGIYVPFWMFDGVADAEAEAEGTRSQVHTSGNTRTTITSHYHVERAGRGTFERIPADASTKMPDDYMDALEPFDYEAIRPFSTAYLPGFLADKFDVKPEECADRAESRMKESALSVLRSSMSGYDTCVTVRDDVILNRGKAHYAMLPVYMLNTRWRGQQYLFAMNGQTGKMVSNLPVSWGKFWGLFAKITVPLTAVLGTLLYLVW